MNDVTIRFLEFYNYLLSIKKVSSSTEFAKEIGISVSMMNEISKGRSNVGIKAIQNTVIKYPIVSAEWLLTGNGRLNDFKIDKPHKNPDEEWAIKTNGIPVIPLDAMAGFGNGSLQVLEYEITDYYQVPLLQKRGAKYLIPVAGNSMYPKYASGDLLACKPLTVLNFVQWGKPYVLDTEQGALVKRLFQDPNNEDLLICKSDNTDHYPPFHISKLEIYKVAIVVGVIRLE